MDLIWLGGFALLCAGIGSLVWACERWLAPRPASRH